MTEIIFHVEDAPEGGLTARALGHSIFTEADTIEELRAAVLDAVHCHFEPGGGFLDEFQRAGRGAALGLAQAERGGGGAGGDAAGLQDHLLVAGEGKRQPRGTRRRGSVG